MSIVKIRFQPSHRELRQFAAIWFPAFCLIVSAVFAWRFGDWTTAALVAGAATCVAVLGITFPSAMRPLYVAWMVAGYPIGWVMAHVALGVIFFLVISPIGIIMRMCGRDPLQRRIDKSQQSYWIDRSEQKSGDISRYFRPF